MTLTQVREFPDKRWTEDGPTRGVEASVEAGEVLRFPYLQFQLMEFELRFRDPRWTQRKSNRIAVSGSGDAKLTGAIGSASDLAALRSMLGRFAEQSEALVLRLFPHYKGHLTRGETTFRPTSPSQSVPNWRKNDTLLHIEAAASHPTLGARPLRVFCNINPEGAASRWRLGEVFEDHVGRYLPKLTSALPGSAWLLEKTGLTRGRRTEYDHVMIQLHDRAKSDSDFQKNSPQTTADFAPGTTWVFFGDQVPHAVMSGQHVIEQTFWLNAEHLTNPSGSPVKTLERLLGRSLR